MSVEASPARPRVVLGYILVFGIAAAAIATAVFWDQIGADWRAESKAKRVVAAQLRDPSSAQFRNLAYHSGFVCGEVNGKNAYGAYEGFVRFYGIGDSMTIDPQDTRVLLAGFPTASEQFDRTWKGYCG